MNRNKYILDKDTQTKGEDIISANPNTCNSSYKNNNINHYINPFCKNLPLCIHKFNTEYRHNPKKNEIRKKIQY